MPGSGTAVAGRGAAPRGQDEWLLTGRSRPSPSTPTPLPLELFHSAAPKREGGGGIEGTALANPPSFMATESSLRVKENFGGGYVSGAAPTGAVNRRLPCPPLPSLYPSFPSFARGTDTAPARAGQAGWAAPSLLSLTLPRPRSSSVGRSRAALRAGERWGRRGEASRRLLGESLAAGGCGQHRRCSDEQTAPGACGPPGRVRGPEVRTCLSLPSRPGRPGEERCCRRSSPAWRAPGSPQRQDRGCEDGNRHGEEETSGAGRG